MIYARVFLVIKGFIPFFAFYSNKSEVTMEASFTNDLGADSLDTVELIMEFEKEFNISIPDEEAEKIQTVGQCVNYLEKDKGEQAG